jgi:putative CocE/NonD family hydrolase
MDCSDSPRLLFSGGALTGRGEVRFSIRNQILASAMVVLFVVSPLAVAAGPVLGAPAHTYKPRAALTEDVQSDSLPHTYQTKTIEERWTMPDGIKLPVMVCYPATSDPSLAFPLVVFVHPWALSSALYEQMARDYAERGYVGLVYTVRGFYGAQGAIDMIGPKTMGDLSHIITLASQDARLPVLEDEKGPVVGVTGYSMGAVHSILISERKNPRPGDPGDPRIRASVPWHGGGDLLFDFYPNSALKLFTCAEIFSTGYLSNLAAFAVKALYILMDSKLSPWGKLAAFVSAIQKLNPPINNVVPEMGWCLNTAMARRMKDKEAVLQYFRLRSARYWCDEEMDGTAEHPIVTPTLFINGWNDEIFYANDNLNMLSYCMEGPSRVILNRHSHAGGANGLFLNGAVGTRELSWIWDETQDWFDHFLKGVENGAENKPRVTYHRGNDDPATYGNADGFPLAGTRYQSLYLGTGKLSTQPPARGGSDILLNIGFTGSVSMPTMNDVTEILGLPQLNMPMRTRLLKIPFTERSFVSSPLGQDTTIMGAPRLELYYRSMQPFAQIIPWIYEVEPGGRETLVSRGWYEGQGLARWAPVTTRDNPIEMVMAYHKFKKGSRIKLELSTADLLMTWPYFTFNQIQLEHGAAAPSRIILPVVPNSN